jgi:carboxymethylenebutenolidase
MEAQWLLPDRMNAWGAAVICLHDIFGFTDDILRISERLASLGYAVLAPNLYDQPGLKPLCVVKTLKAHETGKGYAFDQLEACRTWLLAQQEVSVTQVGMMGFCMGGRFTVLYGSRAPLTVIAPFYGGVPPRPRDIEGICPTVGGWGRRDLIFGGHGKRLERHLDCLGVRHDVKTYEHAGHSYMNNHDTFVFKHLSEHSPLRAAYDEVASEDSWKRVEVFFSEEFASKAKSAAG